MWQKMRYVLIMALTVFATSIVLLPACSKKGRSTAEYKESQENVKKAYPIPANFSSSEVVRLKHLAILGDLHAGARLIEWYDNCVGQNSLLGSSLLRPSMAECQRELQYWLTNNAKYGDAYAAERIFNQSMSTGRCRDVYSAEFWLEEVLKSKRDAVSQSEEVLFRKALAKCGGGHNNSRIAHLDENSGTE